MAPTEVCVAAYALPFPPQKAATSPAAAGLDAARQALKMPIVQAALCESLCHVLAEEAEHGQGAAGALL